MVRSLLLWLVILCPLWAQKYDGPRPPKKDVVYLLHASNLVATEVQEAQQEGKKVYTITDEGRRYLTEQQSTVDDIRSRITAGWDAAQRPEVSDLMHEVQQLARALFRLGTRSLHDPERLKKLREVVARARAEVETLERESHTSPTGAPPNEPRMV